MRRLICVAVAVVIATAPGWGALSQAADPTPDDSIVAGNALAAAAVAVGAANPDFDFWPVYSTSSIDNETSRTLAAGMWPGFLIDAFFWLYGFQALERAALGISESQYPNPPHEAKASSTAFLLGNFEQGCQFLFGPQGGTTEACRRVVDPAIRDAPGAGGASTASSGLLRSNGTAHATRFTYPGLLDASDVRSATSSRFVDGRTIVEGTLTVRDVRIGPSLHIEALHARSEAVAGGTTERSSTASRIRVVGANWNGAPVVIDDQGVHSSVDRSSEAFNEALAAQGLEVRLVRGRERVGDGGRIASATTGGLVVRVARDRAEEAFPVPVQQIRLAACDAADNSPANQEITRVRVSEANPLFGRVPFAPVPERLEAEQSVPPAVGCPFVNRGFEVALVLGVTDASARLSPLPTEEPAVAGGWGNGFVEPDAEPATRDEVLPDPQAAAPASQASPTAPAASSTARDDVLLVARFDEADVARRLRLLYAIVALFTVGTATARKVLRTLAAP